MRLSIIIPTFNRSAILRGLLTALAHDEASLDALDHEIIVVDDQSNDDTCEMVTRDFPMVRLLRGPGKNAEAAKRAAVEISTGDYIVALDDDSMPAPGWLARIKPALERGEVIVQAKIIWVDLGQANIQDESSKRSFRTGFRFDMMPIALLFGGYHPQYINICHEFGCFIARRVLKDVPLDDQNLLFHHLGESASFYLRAKDKGYRVYFEPSCLIEHLGALAGGCKDRSQKMPTKQNCSDFTTGVVHNIMILTRMYQPWRIPILVPYYLAGGIYLSIKQRKNCLKYFARGLSAGLRKKFEPVVPYMHIT